MDLKARKLTGLKTAGDPGADLEDGQFLAYASTWTREPDSYGDVVAKGAFTETLKSLKASGNTLPILFGHDMSDPFSNIGGALEVTEDDHGLLVKGQLDLDNPKAKQVYKMLKGRRISQMSFAFDVQEEGLVDLGNEKSANELRKLKLYEVSIVPVGANQDTEVLAVKAHAESLKADGTISTKNLASLITARDQLTLLIEASKNEDTSKASLAGDVDKEQELKSAAAHSRSAQAVALALIATSL